eukprot:8275123-Alexandrium_andersonii.AAC.1
MEEDDGQRTPVGDPLPLQDPNFVQNLAANLSPGRQRQFDSFQGWQKVNRSRRSARAAPFGPAPQPRWGHQGAQHYQLSPDNG